jgi:hypothetical protein
MLSTDSLRPEVFYPRKTHGNPMRLTYQTQSPGLLQGPLNSKTVEALKLQIQKLTLHQLSKEIFECVCFPVQTVHAISPVIGKHTVNFSRTTPAKLEKNKNFQGKSLLW